LPSPVSSDLASGLELVAGFSALDGPGLNVRFGAVRRFQIDGGPNPIFSGVEHGKVDPLPGGCFSAIDHARFQ
jgi:hypothetical protein